MVWSDAGGGGGGGHYIGLCAGGVKMAVGTIRRRHCRTR